MLTDPGLASPPPMFRGLRSGVDSCKDQARRVCREVFSRGGLSAPPAVSFDVVCSFTDFRGSTLESTEACFNMVLRRRLEDDHRIFMVVGCQINEFVSRVPESRDETRNGLETILQATPSFERGDYYSYSSDDNTYSHVACGFSSRAQFQTDEMVMEDAIDLPVLHSRLIIH